MARELLPRDLFDLPADGDDEAIVARGPNMLLRDRARRLAGRRRLLDRSVAASRTCRATWQRSRPCSARRAISASGPITSRPVTSASPRTRRPGAFSTATALEVDGIVNPDGETIGALEGESFSGEGGDVRQREAACIQNRVRLDNRQIRIDEAQEDFEATSATVIALSEEADSLNSRNDLQLAITVISGGVPAALAIRAGLGIVAALREFARGAVSDIPQLLGAQRDAEDLARRFEDAINQFQRRHQHLQDLLTERRELLQARAEMGCA